MMIKIRANRTDWLPVSVFLLNNDDVNDVEVAVGFFIFYLALTRGKETTNTMHLKSENGSMANAEDLAIFDASMNFVAINQSFNAIIARVVHHEQRGQSFGISCNQQHTHCSI